MKESLASGQGSKHKNVASAISAEDFHPMMVMNRVHNNFIEENKSCGKPGSFDQMDEDVISPVKVFPSLPEDGDPMSVHMEYCLEQLKKFDMAESDEEDDGELPEMQCLPQELIKTIGSTKRSLLSSLDDADSEKRGKFQTRPHVKWGPILSNRPTTRDHGDVKIMDKAKAYQKKKNLEIPISFKEGCSLLSLILRLFFLTI
ncbi:hypothetical protein D1007_58812 [Hordeum vulgare]|nr:hypothetical protein D1007_58812 [Hordeum vulgare]